MAVGVPDTAAAGVAVGCAAVGVGATDVAGAETAGSRAVAPVTGVLAASMAGVGAVVTPVGGAGWIRLACGVGPH